MSVAFPPLDMESTVILTTVRHLISRLVRETVLCLEGNIDKTVHLAPCVQTQISEVTCFIGAIGKTLSQQQFEAINTRLRALREHTDDPIRSACAKAVLDRIGSVVRQPSTNTYKKGQKHGS